MKISVRLFATLERFGTPGPGEMELPPQSRVGDLIRALKIPDRVGRVILVNGRVAGEDRELAPGDEVVFFPPVEGG